MADTPPANWHATWSKPGAFQADVRDAGPKTFGRGNGNASCQQLVLSLACSSFPRSRLTPVQDPAGRSGLSPSLRLPRPAGAETRLPPSLIIRPRTAAPPNSQRVSLPNTSFPSLVSAFLCFNNLLSGIHLIVHYELLLRDTFPLEPAASLSPAPYYTCIANRI